MKRGNNEGTIFPRPNGTYRAQITIDGRRLSYTGKTAKECKAWIRETLDQMDKGLTYDSANLKLNDYAQSWLNMTKLSVRPNTFWHYKHIMENFILPTLGKKKVVELKTSQIQLFYDSMIENGVGIHTVLKTNLVLTSMLNQAERTGIINRNPAKYTIKPKPPEKEMQILDESQVNHLLVSTKGTRWYALMHLAISTGMRKMELLGLKWSDIDWIKKTVSIERQLARSNKVEFAPPKTRQSERTIEIGQLAIDALREHQALQDIWRRKYDWTEYGLIFTTRYGNSINHRTLLRDFKAMLKRVGLPEIRFHDLRHTSASLMLANNIPVHIISRRLGHARPSITLDVYSHVIPSQQEEVAKIMDELITPIALNVKENFPD